jgi:hypothetical protein
MTDEQWAQIKPYAEEVARAQATMDRYRMTNSPLDPRAAMELSAAYQRADMELGIARQKLAEMQKRVLGYTV